MSHGVFLSLDGGDLHARVLLAMASLATVVLPPAHLEHDDFRSAILRHDLSADLGTVHVGLSNLRGIAAANEEDLVEVDLVAGVSGKLLDLKGFAFSNSVLLSACLDDRVHVVVFPRPTRWGRQVGRELYGSFASRQGDRCAHCSFCEFNELA